MAKPLSPPPPLTDLGFADPVWARWLLSLWDCLKSAISVLRFTGGSGIDGTVTVGTDGGLDVTFTTAITGLVKGEGGAFVAAVAGIDFALPSGALAYATPTTGFSLSAAAGVSRLLLQPAAALASGSVTLPPAPVDGQLFSLTSTAAITTLTLLPAAGDALLAPVTSFQAAVTVAYLYRAANTTWYRVQ